MQIFIDKLGQLEQEEREKRKEIKLVVESKSTRKENRQRVKESRTSWAHRVPIGRKGRRKKEK